MRWGRRSDDGDGIDHDDAGDGVEHRLVRVVGPTSGVYGLTAEPARAASGPLADDSVGHDRVPGADPIAARRALAAFDPGRRGLRSLAMAAVIVVVIVGVLVWRARPEAEPVHAPVAVPAATPAPPGTVTIVVAISGKVHRPGLLRLPAGARVADAIDAAGGVLPGTDLSSVNLARKVIDGELLVIGASAPPGGTGATGTGPGAQPGGLVNLNTATVAELDALPGVGPVLAQRIVDYRTRAGGFRSVDELRKVEGVGEARYAQLKDLVTV